MKLIETETNKVVAKITEDLELEVVDTENYELKEGDVYKKGEQDRVAFMIGEEITYIPHKYRYIAED